MTWLQALYQSYVFSGGKVSLCYFATKLRFCIPILVSLDYIDIVSKRRMCQHLLNWSMKKQLLIYCSILSFAFSYACHNRENCSEVFNPDCEMGDAASMISSMILIDTLNNRFLDQATLAQAISDSAIYLKEKTDSIIGLTLDGNRPINNLDTSRLPSSVEASELEGEHFCPVSFNTSNIVNEARFQESETVDLVVRKDSADSSVYKFSFTIQRLPYTECEDICEYRVNRVETDGGQIIYEYERAGNNVYWAPILFIEFPTN